jgi:hemerythrin-like domain-containing protein
MAAMSTAPRLVAQGKGRAATKKGDEDEKISLAEDLMREHGVLKRVLLIYREVMNRIDSKRDFPPNVVFSSAKLIRAFVEDYHEKLEEDYLFPRFRKASKLVDLVDVLNQQHQKGRVLEKELGIYDLAQFAHSDDADQSFRSHADQIGAKRRRALSV